ncbi:MAG TPA: hypothetical protein VGG04_03255 [Candidatus Sulfotelmatobacter sp.]
MVNDRQTRADSRTELAGQVKACLDARDYACALEALRGAGTEFPDDAELAVLEHLAQDGLQRKAEADRLITESQELFAQQKAADAIALLRRAYELDQKNPLARAILANALVEHAHSFVENDWLEAEKLTNQALALNPAHPTAKTILNRIVEKKQTSPVDEWVAQARKLQSSGDLFGALAWVAEGLAVHPNDSALLQIHDSIQRDQGARKRQARRRDMDDLRRMELEIDVDADPAAKQALAERIQLVAARYWTDGEILAVANGLLHRLGLAPKENAAGSSRSKSAAVIFHVPRTNAPKAPLVESAPAASIAVAPSAVSSKNIPADSLVGAVAPVSAVPRSEVSSTKVSLPIAPTTEVAAIPAQPPNQPQAVAVEPVAEAPKARRAVTSGRQSKSVIILAISAIAIILLAAVFFVAQKHRVPAAVNTPAASPSISASRTSAPAASTPAATAPGASAPEVAAQDSTSMQAVPEPTPSTLAVPAENGGEKAVAESPAPVGSAHNFGTLVIAVNQDNAQVLLNGKVQRQLTRSGQLRLSNLEARDYIVQVSKSGFQDAPQQQVRIRNGEQARMVFNLQPQLRPASLSIQGGVPGTSVWVDQSVIGAIQADGTLTVSNVNPGDHTIELRRERFKPRVIRKHFVAGAAVALAAADAALEAAPAELTITFTPPDAKVAIAKGDSLTFVSSGVPLNLPAGTYTLTARTADRFTRSATLEVAAGQSRALDLPLAPNGMSKWDDPGGWKQEKDSFVRRGGDFVLYSVTPAAGTFVFSAMPAKGHVLQWVLNYSDPKNYVLCRMDENNFYRTVIRNGEKRDEIIVPDKGDKKNFRAFHIRVSASEIVHQVKHGESWTVLDRWTQPGTNLSSGKFGFYIPGSDEVALSGFAHYADLNLR